MCKDTYIINTTELESHKKFFLTRNINIHPPYRLYAIACFAKKITLLKHHLPKIFSEAP